MRWIRAMVAFVFLAGVAGAQVKESGFQTSLAGNLASERNVMRMGLAIADKPVGPYVKSQSNPIVPGGHAVLVWAYGKGVVAQIGKESPKGVRRTLQYADDGITFTKMSDMKDVPKAGGRIVLRRSRILPKGG